MELVSTMTVFFRFSHRPPERGYSSAAFIGSFTLTELLAAIFGTFCNSLQLTAASELRSITGWKKCTINLLAAAKNEHLDFALSNGVRTFQCADVATLTYHNLQLRTVLTQGTFSAYFLPLLFTCDLLNEITMHT